MKESVNEVMRGYLDRKGFEILAETERNGVQMFVAECEDFVAIIENCGWGHKSFPDSVLEREDFEQAMCDWAAFCNGRDFGEFRFATISLAVNSSKNGIIRFGFMDCDDGEVSDC